MGLLRRARRPEPAPAPAADEPAPQLRVWRGNGGSGDWFWRITAADGRWLANDSAGSHDAAMTTGLAALAALRDLG